MMRWLADWSHDCAASRFRPQRNKQSKKPRPPTVPSLLYGVVKDEGVQSWYTGPTDDKSLAVQNSLTTQLVQKNGMPLRRLAVSESLNGTIVAEIVTGIGLEELLCCWPC